MSLGRWDIFFCHFLTATMPGLCAKINPPPPMKSGRVLPQPAVCTLHRPPQTHVCVSKAAGCYTVPQSKAWTEPRPGSELRKSCADVLSGSFSFVKIEVEWERMWHKNVFYYRLIVEDSVWMYPYGTDHVHGLDSMSLEMFRTQIFKDAAAFLHDPSCLD